MQVIYKYKQYNISIIKNINDIIITFIDKNNKMYKEIYHLSLIEKYNLNFNEFYHMIIKSFNVLIYDDPNNDKICFICYDNFLNVKIFNYHGSTINLYLLNFL